MIFSGIDEAALGPVLGPFCAASVSLTSKADELPNFTDHFKSAGLQFGDSKKIYSSQKGIKKLEYNVLALLSCVTKKVPETIFELISMVYPESPEWRYLPWFEELGNAALPRAAAADEVETSSKVLIDIFQNLGITVSQMNAVMASAEQFNYLIDQSQNKATAVRDVITPLVRQTVSHLESLLPVHKLVIDCQGGRRYYDDWLGAVLPGYQFESPGGSVYKTGYITISFEIKADQHFIPTAMASMLAKYLREVMMEQFNLYWQKMVPGIKSTAGYPQDGRRFINDLKAAGVNICDQLVRKR